MKHRTDKGSRPKNTGPQKTNGNIRTKAYNRKQQGKVELTPAEAKRARKRMDKHDRTYCDGNTSGGSKDTRLTRSEAMRGDRRKRKNIEVDVRNRSGGGKIQLTQDEAKRGRKRMDRHDTKYYDVKTKPDSKEPDGRITRKEAIRAEERRHKNEQKVVKTKKKTSKKPSKKKTKKQTKNK
jgi:hypothetical protein